MGRISVILQSGDIEKNRIIGSLFVLLALFVTACSPNEQQSKAEAQNYTCPMHPNIVQEQPGSCPICGMDLVPINQQGQDQGIMLSERQIALANIKIAEVGKDTINKTTWLNGQLRSNLEKNKVISSRVSGRIEKLYFKETGLRINKGQPLYKIYSEKLLTLQKEYLLMYQQNLELGEKNKRFATFLKAAKNKLLLYGITASQIKQLSKSNELSPYISFVSPVSGIIRSISASEGQYVGEGSSLYTIGSFDQLWVEAELYPKDLQNVKIGDKLNIVVTGFENRPLKAKVVFISPEYVSGTQTIKLRAEVANPQSVLMPGMQARVALEHPNTEGLSLPLDAVIRGENGAHVWVKTGNGTFIPQNVKVGTATENRITILEGLQQGDSVVISGAYLLNAEMILKKGKQPISHQHETK